MSMFKTVAKVMVSSGIKGQKSVKRLSRIAKLQLNLKLEKDKQNLLYQEIGQHVHVDQVTDVMHSVKIRSLREKITMQENKIKRLVTQINRLKKVNICLFCGNTLLEEQKYCPKCSRPRKLD